jgi:CRISPR-associated protein Cmr2
LTLISYLYVLSIGPVQDFIAAARRTRDLWFGSHLLSEISKAAAKSIAKDGGMLIFPALDAGSMDLEPSKDPETFNVANIILAELPDVKEPSVLDGQAQAAAQKEWEKYAEEARSLAGGAVRQDIWDEQIYDVIDFYSAWVPISGKYSDDHGKLMRLLNGRKSIRDFVPSKGRSGVPKSSLDGARESVLKKDSVFPKELALKMRLNDGEQLCAVGLTKRLGGGRETFPSIIRVAADPWIRGIRRTNDESNKDEANKLLDEIVEICQRENGFASGTGRRYYKNFPFDGQVLYPSRLARLMKPQLEKRGGQRSWEDLLTDSDRISLTEIRRLVEKLQKNEEGGLGLGEPGPYVAVLVADGDHMGRVISARESKEDHRKFSKKLAEFAKLAREIIRDNNGVLVYSGGDDILAFLPVDCCLKAARELHKCFGKLLMDFRDKENKSPTLSVGIAIGHSMETLENLREYGKAAEKDSKKPDRNGLAVHLYTRSGGEPIRIREQWDIPGKTCLDDRLREWAEMHRMDELPDKAAYDLRELSEDYKGWKDTPKEELSKLISADSQRLLKRKKSGVGASSFQVNKIEPLLDGIDSYEKIRCLADELIMARRLADSIIQAEGTAKKQEDAS